MIRRISRAVRVGDVTIGAGSPVSIQSMTNTYTRDVDQTVKQIEALVDAGCEIVRLAVPDSASAQALGIIKKRVKIPVVADIHYDYRLALESLKAGADKLRLNPGNIGGADKVKAVAREAASRGVPIRVGVNSGSLEKDLFAKYGGVTPEALVESALRSVEILENQSFKDIVIAVKSSDVTLSVSAYELLAKHTDYPFHVGITEAGTVYGGSIKSAVGIGAVLSRGLGDTIRVSLTGDPLEEVRCAREILQSLGLRRFGVELVSCPTCGRTSIDLIGLAERIEAYCKDIKTPLKVAVMGCVVNGPGESKDADIGVTGGDGKGVIFKKGEIFATMKEDELFPAFVQELEKMVGVT
ncbi:MAG: flavodoxin-dependent (E)-4-hydroxy-3-methylbut-2-enyl-diphosphate synthase [Clostridiales bacterium]|nr:flavodoxin-dependent (E)-4-hydroxy-3-methylbut-2-enyl-diphosphate synthase [Clostridiales bacterium]